MGIPPKWRLKVEWRKLLKELLSVFLLLVYLLWSLFQAAHGWKLMERWIIRNLFNLDWNFCLQDFKDVKHLYDRVFNGCRHVLDEEYHIIDWLLRPPFFIAVQTFFTFTFMLIILAFIGTPMYVVCFTLEHQVKLLRALSIDLTIAGICGTLAVIIFGALGDSRDWMPDFEHNFLSWSFGLAVVGTFGCYLSAALFYIEAKVQAKKQMATTSQATFSLEHKV